VFGRETGLELAGLACSCRAADLDQVGIAYRLLAEFLAENQFPLSRILL
jgi:hypothetical protein